MPRQRSSGRKSSSDNKSDIEQHEEPNSNDFDQAKQQSPPKEHQQQIDASNNQQLQSKQSEKDRGQQPVKELKQPEAPNRYTLYRESFNFNWNMKDFDITKAVEQFGKLDRYQELQNSDDETQQSQSQIDQLKQKKEEKQIQLKIFSSNQQTTGLNKKTTYFINGRDKNGAFQISRVYKEFVLLRQKLVLRWPGCFIAPLPTKTLGNNPYELVLIRMRFLNSFLKKLSNLPQIYYSQQCRLFFNHTSQQYIHTNNKLIESQLQKLKAHTNSELLEKYKEAYGNSVEDLTEEQQSIAITQIKELQTELMSWKVDLSRFKEEIRSLINVKDKYYQAMTRLNITLLPEYEDIVLGWINGDDSLKNQTTNQKQGYLLNTQEYGTALRDTALSVKNYNQSLWLIYDIFKFQLRETDSILEAIDSYEFLVREKDYLIRNIGINKDQIQSLEVKKTTLKIFMMSGSVEQKRERLNKESQSFEERLKVVKQLLNFVLNILINSIDAFHTDRAEQYKKRLAKSGQQQLVLVKKLMDFHIFQLQIFKRKDIFGSKNESGLAEEQIFEQ